MRNRFGHRSFFSSPVASGMSLKSGMHDTLMRIQSRSRVLSHGRSRDVSVSIHAKSKLIQNTVSSELINTVLPRIQSPEPSGGGGLAQPDPPPGYGDRTSQWLGLLEHPHLCKFKRCQKTAMKFDKCVGTMLSLICNCDRQLQMSQVADVPMQQRPNSNCAN